jgi:hypothetical protein
MVQPPAANPRPVTFVAISPKRFSLNFPFIQRFGWVEVSAPEGICVLRDFDC